MTTTNEKQWIFIVSHTGRSVTCAEWCDAQRNAIIDDANRGDGLPNHRDETLIEYVNQDNSHAGLYTGNALVRRYGMLVRHGGHMAAEQRIAIMDAAEHDDDLMRELMTNDFARGVVIRKIIVHYTGDDWDREALNDVVSRLSAGLEVRPDVAGDDMEEIEAMRDALREIAKARGHA